MTVRAAPADPERNERPSFADRVNERALSIRFLVTVLSIVAWPFWLIGACIAYAWLAIRWCCAAFVLGFTEVKAKRDNGTG